MESILGIGGIQRPSEDVDGTHGGNARLAPRRPALQPTPESGITLRDVGATPASPNLDEWLIEGVLRPGAILVVAAPEGLGKSYVRKEMATRLSTIGGSLFGHYRVVERCPVVEIDEENGDVEEQRREVQVFAALGIRRDDVVDYWSSSLPGLELNDKTSRTKLRQTVAAKRPGVLMLDTGTSMIGDEWGAEFKGAMRFLRSLSTDFGCAIVIFVHLVKPARGKGASRYSDSSLADVMGHWTRSADAVAILVDLGGGRAQWSMFKKVPKSTVVIPQADGLWRLVRVGTEPKTATALRVLQEIVAGGSNAPAMADSLGVSRRSVFNAIKRLRDDGFLAPGLPYTVTDSGHEALS
jgi:AAA domain-containing protein